MAVKPLHPCAHAGCRELVRGAYCDRHRPKDNTRRSAEAVDWHTWYRLPVWRYNLRPAQLLREPFCRECATRGKKEGVPHLLRVPATDVDHVVPHRGSWQLFIDPANHQSLCHSCHSRKTAAEMAENARKKAT